LEKSLSIEREIYAQIDQQEYVGFVRQRILFLKEKSNLDLKARLLLGYLEVDYFVKTSIYILSNKAKK